jgi:hypothetical protein
VAGEQVGALMAALSHAASDRQGLQEFRHWTSSSGALLLLVSGRTAAPSVLAASCHCFIFWLLVLPLLLPGALSNLSSLLNCPWCCWLPLPPLLVAARSPPAGAGTSTLCVTYAD